MFNWFSFLTYAFTTAFTPGPNNIMSMTNAGRRGFRGAMPFNFGILAGFTIVMFLCTVFCSALSAWVPRIKTPMLAAGAVYMLYLAWETFRGSGDLGGHAAKDGFFTALALQFINPKLYLYCIMSMEAYILPFYQGRPGALIFFALLLSAIGFAATLAWTAFGSAFRRLFERHAKLVNTVMALLLVYCAASLFMS